MLEPNLRSSNILAPDEARVSPHEEDKAEAQGLYSNPPKGSHSKALNMPGLPVLCRQLFLSHLWLIWDPANKSSLRKQGGWLLLNPVQDNSF